MEGSIPQKMVSFYDKIAALLGPIATWEDYVDVKNAERLAKHQTRLFCDQLNLFDASSLSYNRNANASPNGTWELDALGAAQLTSRTDTGDVILDASRIGYAAANDAVRIEGSIQRPATIRRLSTDGSNDSGQSIQVSSASMRLKTGQIDAQIRKIEGGLPANMQPPLPGGNSPGASPNGARPPGSNPALGPTLPNSGVLPSARDFNPLQPRGTRP